MQIQLISALSLPTVLHLVTYPDSQSKLPLPASWSNQLICLQEDELDCPATLYSLDKAAGITSLLTNVIFDLPNMTISCQFVDGTIEEWPIKGDDCVSAIEEVIFDVNEALLEAEREAEKEKELEREKQRTFRTASLPPPARGMRHKRQRSLLMSLVAAIVPMSLNISSSSPRVLPSSTPIGPIPSTSLIPPRIRQRRSRSAMIDIYRQYALTELARRFPPGGYYAWIIQSMLRRAAEEMERLVRQAGGSPDPMMHYNPEESEFFSITAASLPPTPSVSDDEGDEPLWLEDTDTDGSSVHTPSSSHFNPIRYASDPTECTSDPYSSAPGSHQHYPSESDHAKYMELVATTNRLNKLLILEQTRRKNFEEDQKQHFRILEVRSRRRAWLNKTLIGGVRSESVDMGMAMPFQSSPLAQNSWTCNEYEYTPDEETFPVQEYDEYDELELRMRRTRKSAQLRLFPVCEEDSEADGEDDARELELHFQGFGIDLEGGVVRPEDGNDDDCGVRVAFEVERPPLRPRVRTNSMYAPNTPSPVEIDNPRPQRLTPSSILYQPFSVDESQEKVADIEQPPMYQEVDDNVKGLDFGNFDGGHPKYSDEEFTLGMDLPFSVRVQERDIFANRKGLVVDDYHGWMPSEMR